jgi:peptidoglycan/LPS O-acetylase OafA/YrhL
MKYIIILLAIATEIYLFLFSWNGGANTFLSLLFLLVLFLLPVERKDKENVSRTKGQFPKCKIPLCIALLFVFLLDPKAQTGMISICFLFFLLLLFIRDKRNGGLEKIENETELAQKKRVQSFAIACLLAMPTSYLPAQFWFSLQEKTQAFEIPRPILNFFIGSAQTRYYDETSFCIMYLLCFTLIFGIFLVLREKCYERK